MTRFSCWKLRHTKQATERIESYCHLDIEVCIAAARHRARYIYRGHCHSFFSVGHGVARVANVSAAFKTRFVPLAACALVAVDGSL